MSIIEFDLENGLGGGEKKDGAGSQRGHSICMFFSSSSLPAPPIPGGGVELNATLQMTKLNSIPEMNIKILSATFPITAKAAGNLSHPSHPMPTLSRSRGGSSGPSPEKRLGWIRAPSKYPTTGSKPTSDKVSEVVN